jgi:hypothetical protein
MKFRPFLMGVLSIVSLQAAAQPFRVESKNDERRSFQLFEKARSDETWFQQIDALQEFRLKRKISRKGKTISETDEIFTGTLVPGTPEGQKVKLFPVTAKQEEEDHSFAKLSKVGSSIELSIDRLHKAMLPAPQRHRYNLEIVKGSWDDYEKNGSPIELRFSNEGVEKYKSAAKEALQIRAQDLVKNGTISINKSDVECLVNTAKNAAKFPQGSIKAEGGRLQIEFPPLSGKSDIQATLLPTPSQRSEMRVQQVY